MKIFLDLSRMNTGGAIQNGLSLLHHLDRCDRHEYLVVLSRRLAREYRKGEASPASPHLHLEEVGGQSHPLAQCWEAWRALPALEEKFQPQIVFSLSGPSLWRAKAPHAEGYAIPHLLYPEIVPKLPLTRRQRQKLSLILRWTKLRIRKGKHFVVQTEIVRQRLSQQLGIKLDSISVVKNTFSPLFQAGIVQGKSEGISPQEQTIILVPSAFYPHKNLHLLPRLAYALRKRGTEDFIFRCTIPPHSTPWQQLTTEATQLGVLTHLETIGTCPHAELPRHYLESTAIFLPTLLECSSSVYPESFFAHRPVVTSDFDFSRELCGAAAEYCNPFDLNDTAGALHRVLSDLERQRTLTTAGTKQLETYFPDPSEKWTAQRELLERLVASHEGFAS
ncbi:glycosyltransferase [bacterium]|nr:glycosyltransferase [bacterium]